MKQRITSVAGTGVVPFVVLLAVAWIVSLAVSLAVSLRRDERVLRELARIHALVAYERDVLYRLWNSSKGAVYVSVDERTTPNPYLDVPEREIITPSGQVLTRMNPAYMNREVYELARSTGQARGHLTSLNPLRRENSPDLWEIRALESFEHGATEASSLEMVDGQEQLRFMRPLLVEPSCLGCHAKQGHEVGQIRGGLSVSVPMAQLRDAAWDRRLTLWATHCALGFIGVVGLLAAGGRLTKRASERDRAREELKQANETLQKLSTTDPLTGLMNRRHLMSGLEAECRRSHRSSRPLSLLMVDVDHFKSVNDRFGHVCGDEVLKAVATTLRENVRATDLVARYGGEEFVVVLSDTELAAAQHVAEKLRQRISAVSLDVPGDAAHVTVSIGVASMSGEPARAEELLRSADEALYDAKNSGRNSVRVMRAVADA